MKRFLFIIYHFAFSHLSFFLSRFPRLGRLLTAQFLSGRAIIQERTFPTLRVDFNAQVVGMTSEKFNERGALRLWYEVLDRAA